MMTMHMTTEVSVRLGEFPNHMQIDLIFDKTPTKDEIFVAAKELLLDQEYVNAIATMFLETINILDFPKTNDVSRGILKSSDIPLRELTFAQEMEVSLWHLTNFMFKLDR